MKVTRSHYTKPTGKPTIVTPQMIVHVHPSGDSSLGVFVCTQRKEIPMAQLITPSGSVREIHPEYGAACFTTSELHALVDGWLECVHLPDGRLMWINEEDKLRVLPSNPLATLLATWVLQPYNYVAGPAGATTEADARVAAPS